MKVWKSSALVSALMEKLSRFQRLKKSMNFGVKRSAMPLIIT